MAEKERRQGGNEAAAVADLVGQLRGLTERLAGTVASVAGPALSALPSLPGAAGVPGIPPAVALSAAQIHAMTSTVAAQRRSIDALRTQLTAFDDQLEVLEGILQPLAGWSRALADVEARVLHPLGRAEPPSGG